MFYCIIYCMSRYCANHDMLIGGGGGHNGATRIEPGRQAHVENEIFSFNDYYLTRQNIFSKKSICSCGPQAPPE